MAEVGKYTIVDKEDNIINVVDWDEETSWKPDEDTIAVKYEESDHAMIGGT